MPVACMREGQSQSTVVQGGNDRVQFTRGDRCYPGTTGRAISLFLRRSIIEPVNQLILSGGEVSQRCVRYELIATCFGK